MLPNILKQINWVDIFVLIVVLRICYVSVKSGFPAEIFKLCGTLTALYVALHYYAPLADYLNGLFSLGGRVSSEFQRFVIFLVLAGAGYGIFVLLRNIFSHFIKMEALSALNKWGGLVLGLVRSALSVSLILFIMTISSIGYLKTSVENSYLGTKLFCAAPDTYTWIWSNIASKFAANQGYNSAVTDVKERTLTK